jgi:FMN phosphatase YigB (HAD superfamily)
MQYRAVIFDLGGVVFPSPFDVFAEYERCHALPDRFIREVVAASGEHGAWARLERSEVSFEEFCVTRHRMRRGGRGRSQSGAGHQPGPSRGRHA